MTFAGSYTIRASSYYTIIKSQLNNTNKTHHITKKLHEFKSHISANNSNWKHFLNIVLSGWDFNRECKNRLLIKQLNAGNFILVPFHLIFFFH